MIRLLAPEANGLAAALTGGTGLRNAAYIPQYMHTPYFLIKTRITRNYFCA
jgi:hypothetical protein